MRHAAATGADRGATVARHCGEPCRRAAHAGHHRRPPPAVALALRMERRRARAHDRDRSTRVRACVELISTYTGHTDTDTIATHLILGQGRDSEIDSCRHPHEQLNPVELARACAYDHASRLMKPSETASIQRGSNSASTHSASSSASSRAGRPGRQRRPLPMFAPWRARGSRGTGPRHPGGPRPAGGPR